jgi:hypothetical protein
MLCLTGLAVFREQFGLSFKEEAYTDDIRSEEVAAIAKI